MSFDVVVPVAEGAAPSDECMQPLRRQAADLVRVVSGTFVWQARQRALEDSTADIVVFVDPDVVVSDHWLQAVRVAWDAAPRSIAAIGGPIRGDAPEWAHGRLGLIDLGSDVRDLDPMSQTLFAGNLSLRRRPAVAVGGFEPPVDRHDSLDWLSEEHELQRQLGHWGWLIRYAPALAARREIAAPRTVARSWRYGVRTGIADSRDAGTALRQGLRSGLGMVAAGATGRRAAAAERAGRAVENLGVLVGSRRARLPGRTAAHPPAPHGPSPAPNGTTTAPSAAQVDLVLLYHRFAEGEPDPLGLCVSPRHFEEQLQVLGELLDVVPLGTIAERLTAGGPGAGRVAITIDDGYLDNFTTGIPSIAHAGLPATLFISTAHVETGRLFFWDEMASLLNGAGKRPRKLELFGHTWSMTTPDQREEARNWLHGIVQPLTLEETERALAEMREWAGTDPRDEAARAMTVEQLKRLAETPGLEIGAHTRDHVNLGHQTPDVIRAEVERSRDDLAAWLGTRPLAFSYPFGIPRHDVGDEARAAVAAAGFRYAVVNQPVPVEPRDDVLAIPRLVVPDVGADEFRAWLARMLG